MSWTYAKLTMCFKRWPQAHLRMPGTSTLLHFIVWWGSQAQFWQMRLRHSPNNEILIVWFCWSAQMCLRWPFEAFLLLLLKSMFFQTALFTLTTSIFATVLRTCCFQKCRWGWCFERWIFLSLDVFAMTTYKRPTKLNKIHLSCTIGSIMSSDCCA